MTDETMETWLHDRWLDDRLNEDPLSYYGSVMSMEPINIPIDEAACIILYSYPVYICLEPGDATRYEFDIFPLRTHLFAFVPRNLHATSHGIVVSFEDDRKHLCAQLCSIYPNEWTPILVSKFLITLFDLIKPQPCEQCGTEERVEMHHKNYDKPLEISWLCRPCHMNLHSKKCHGRRVRGSEPSEE